MPSRSEETGTGQVRGFCTSYIYIGIVLAVVFPTTPRSSSPSSIFNWSSAVAACEPLLGSLHHHRMAAVTRAPSGVLSPSPLRDGAGPAAPAASGQIYFTPDQFSARFGGQFFTAELIDRRTAAADSLG